jgi:hypoxanthine phosphoribosyltransferase
MTQDYTHWQPGMKKEMYYVDWDTIEFLVEELEMQIRLEHKQYDAVVGILRGGLVPAVMLSHRLKLPMYVVTPSSMIDETNKKLLFVDEIYDTGKTIYALRAKHSNADFAVLYHNSDLPPLEYYAVRDSLDKWIVFPWEIQE